MSCTPGMVDVIEFNYPDFILPAFDDPHKFVIIRAGRRSGKTYNAFIWILEELMMNNGARGLWVDTIQGNLHKYVERYVQTILGGAFATIKWDKEKNILKFANGSTLDMGSAERPENLEGFGYDFVVLNEAGIILKSESLWLNTLEPMCKDAKVKIIGTPKGLNYYYDLSQLCLTEEDWVEYHFSCYDSPFYTEEDLDKIQRRVPPSVWKGEYLAEFTSGGEEDALLTLEQVKATIIEKPIPIPENPQIMSVDVALKNDKAVWVHHDMTQVCHLIKYDPKKEGKVETPDIARKTFDYQRDFNVWDRDTIVDSDGLGVGVVGELNQFYDQQVVEFHSNLPIPKFFRYPQFLEQLDFYRFGNIRAQLAFVLRELIINESFDLPYDQDLMNELCELRYINRNGKFYLESKKEMKKRIGRSPDTADALIYSMYPFLYKLVNGLTVALYK